MKYLNAEDILPKHLIQEIQNYVAGGYVYIPAQDEKKAWGTRTGIRRELSARNQQICEIYAAGRSVKALAEEYCLSESSIYKIIRKIKR